MIPARATAGNASRPTPRPLTILPATDSPKLKISKPSPEWSKKSLIDFLASSIFVLIDNAKSPMISPAFCIKLLALNVSSPTFFIPVIRSNRKPVIGPRFSSNFSRIEYKFVNGSTPLDAPSLRAVNKFLIDSTLDETESSASINIRRANSKIFKPSAASLPEREFSIRVLILLPALLDFATKPSIMLPALPIADPKNPSIASLTDFRPLPTNSPISSIVSINGFDSLLSHDMNTSSPLITKDIAVATAPSTIFRGTIPILIRTSRTVPTNLTMLKNRVNTWIKILNPSVPGCI